MTDTFNQNSAVQFARQVLETRDRENALKAYNRLDTVFARDPYNRRVDSLMSSLDRLMSN